MTEKNSNIDDKLNKKDLEIILEVSKKAIEIETEAAEQNEEIIDSLGKTAKEQSSFEEKIDKIIKQNEEINKDLFKIKVLFLSGLLSLIMQVIQLLKK